MHIQVLFLLTAVTLTMGQWEQIGRKPGDCPPYPNIGICGRTCFADIQCVGQRKCCRTACGGTFCTSPVTPRVTQVTGKPGDCPKPSGPWVCSSRCAVDSDCRGNKKCCKNRCGALACIKSDEPPRDVLDNEVF